MTFRLCMPVLLLLCSAWLTEPLLAADINGLWTKTTSPDPQNITIFYQEKNTIRAMGYGEISGKKVVWYSVGDIKGNRLHCYYHHSLDTIPPGWEQGIMSLTVSDDGHTISGTATSVSGKWHGKIIFKRIR